MTDRAIIATLAHNRAFTAREITEYTAFDCRINGTKLVQRLLKKGLIQRLERGTYYPTPSGWEWIERGG